MSPELSLLRAFIDDRELYDRYRKTIDTKTFENKPLARLYDVLDTLYSEMVGHTSPEALEAYFATIDSNNGTDAAAKEFVTQLREGGVDEGSRQALVDTILKRQISFEIARRAIEIGRKQGVSVQEQFRDFSNYTREQFGALEEATVDPNELDDPFISDDLQTLLESTVLSRGLRWRLNTLNRMLGSLRKGDFGFIFARPETGKTTFLASEVSHMAEQLEPGQIVLWFNNEEQGGKVKLRVYQASLGKTMRQLMENVDGNKEEYLVRTGGSVKIVDSSTIDKFTIERLCQKYKPALVILDQIDKIRGFDADREDLRLGSIYIWARELAKSYCPVIAVCQADGTGEGVKWLTMAHVANAKTSKQAEADWILGIGNTNTPGLDYIRHLNISKNKLTGDDDSDPSQRHGRADVVIRPDIARYEDIG